jgi:hypothetical protein
MKTTAVKKTPVVNFPNGNKIHTKQNPDGELTIKNNALGKWIDSINKAPGAFFLHLDALSGLSCYSIHYKCHMTGKLMVMEYKESPEETEDQKKAYMDALLFDLELFQGDEPIVVFDKDQFELQMQKQFPIMYEHTDAIDQLMERVYDLKEIFETRMYYDTLFKEATIREIYRVLYGHGHKEKMQIPDSLAMYQIFEALQSIYYQVTGLRVIA